MHLIYFFYHEMWFDRDTAFQRSYGLFFNRLSSNDYISVLFYLIFFLVIYFIYIFFFVLLLSLWIMYFFFLYFSFFNCLRNQMNWLETEKNHIRFSHISLQVSFLMFIRLNRCVCIHIKNQCLCLSIAAFTKFIAISMQVLMLMLLWQLDVYIMCSFSLYNFHPTIRLRS